jgi:hypothetical protein
MEIDKPGAAKILEPVEAIDATSGDRR